MELTSSWLEMAPTAMTASRPPSAWRIRSANGVWYDRPNAGFSWDTTWPDETCTNWAPWSTKAVAIATASDSVLPPSAQSTAEMRTPMARSAGHTARRASNTSNG